MSTNREIITLQLGDYANHVATHYWNLEWENANLNPSNIDTKDNDDNTTTNTLETNTTNPYKSSKYNQLKNRSNKSHLSDHSGKPLKKQQSHKNINPNICFHSTVTPNKTIYTPRTIVFATQGSEGNINSNIYDSSSNYSSTKNTNISTWNNNINIVQKSQNIPKTENQSDCKFWSDYLLPTLHNKSLFSLEGIHHFSSPFYSYSTGYDLLNSGTTTSNDLVESIDDRIRWFVESCDWFQAFQIFETSYNSFSGFLPTIVNTIHDDYSNKCVLLYNLLPSKTTMQMETNINQSTPNKQTLQMMQRRFKLNSIISTAQIWDEVSNIIPITVDFWDTQKRQNTFRKKFYNSSIIGSCLHHFTNGVRLNNSNIRLMDIINCYVKTTSMKMSMLSSCSTHLDLNMNYQAINSIEKLLMGNINQASNRYQNKNQPIFPRLSCLGPVDGKYLNDNYILNSKIFGEYSCLSGSDLYDTSDKIIKEWKQNKMILAQKQGSSKSDIESYCNKWTYESEKQDYHLRLMTRLASKTESPLKWHLINRPWKLPSVHPFYYDDKNEKNNEKKQENDEEYDDEEKEENMNRNKYSIWSSGWSSSIIGESYLTESAGNVNQIIKYGIGEKIFGDVELELGQYQEELTALANTYSGEKDIDAL